MRRIRSSICAVVRVDPDNHASAMVARHAGFDPAGQVTAEGTTLLVLRRPLR
ncbi:MAG TPA: hypothetical protein VJM33_03420 [Microthrixaceae bacterium]|nr:hypothetical protein [Microthrixaceae bacterium]